MFALFCAPAGTSLAAERSENGLIHSEPARFLIREAMMLIITKSYSLRMKNIPESFFIFQPLGTLFKDVEQALQIIALIGEITSDDLWRNLKLHTEILLSVRKRDIDHLLTEHCVLYLHLGGCYRQFL